MVVKKIHIKKALFAVIAILLCTSLGETHKTDAAAIADENVMVDYVYDTLTVTTAVDNIIYYTDTYTDDHTKWYTCEVRNGKASFDISWVKNTVTVRLYICGDVQDKIISKDITWQETFGATFVGSLRATDITEAETWKAKYAAYPKFSEDTGYFIFTVKTNGRATSYFKLDTIEWRKGDTGVWRPFSELDLKEMYIKGINLSFRIKAVNDVKVTDGAGTRIEDGTRTSTVAKVQVSKLASPPNTKLDFTSMTVDLKNGLEFSYDKSSWILIPLYSKYGNTSDVYITDAVRDAAIAPIETTERHSKALLQTALQIPLNTQITKAALTPFGRFTMYQDDAGNDAGIILYVRTAGTERKTASKINEIHIPFVAQGNAPANVFTCEFAQTAAFTGSAIVTNTSTTETYQFAIVQAATHPSLADLDVSENGLKWITLKPGKTTKIVQTNDFYIVYRIPGTNTTLPSAYTATGLIKPTEQITYAKINSSVFQIGKKLVAITNGNMSSSTLHYTWQRRASLTEGDWENIAGVDAPEYEMTTDDELKYIRVVISNASSSRASDHVGPVMR